MSITTAATDANFTEVVLNADRPVLVDFWADWCGPCKQLSPIIEELAEQHGDRVAFVKVDAGNNPATAAAQQVMGLPTVQIYLDGRLVKALRGAKSKAALLKALQPYL